MRSNQSRVISTLTLGTVKNRYQRNSPDKLFPECLIDNIYMYKHGSSSLKTIDRNIRNAVIQRIHEKHDLSCSGTWQLPLNDHLGAGWTEDDSGGRCQVEALQLCAKDTPRMCVRAADCEMCMIACKASDAQETETMQCPPFP